MQVIKRLFWSHGNFHVVFDHRRKIICKLITMTEDVVVVTAGHADGDVIQQLLVPGGSCRGSFRAALAAAARGGLAGGSTRECRMEHATRAGLPQRAAQRRLPRHLPCPVRSRAHLLPSTAYSCFPSAEDCWSRMVQFYALRKCCCCSTFANGSVRHTASMQHCGRFVQSRTVIPKLWQSPVRF